jgi:hypothetical protein
MFKLESPRRCGRCEGGQTTVEYAIILAALGIAAIVAIFFMSGTIRATFFGVTPSAETPRSGDAQPLSRSVTCDASYSGACIPPPPPDLDCDDLARMGITSIVNVTGSDPHHLDGDGDGIACN